MFEIWAQHNIMSTCSIFLISAINVFFLTCVLPLFQCQRVCDAGEPKARPPHALQFAAYEKEIFANMVTIHLPKMKTATTRDTAMSDWGSWATPGDTHDIVDYHYANHCLARQKDTKGYDYMNKTMKWCSYAARNPLLLKAIQPLREFSTTVQLLHKS